MLTDTFQKISAHDHSGSGNGAQLGAASFTDNAINDLKMRLRNNEYFRSRNAAGTGDVNILRIGSDGRLELNSFQHHIESFSLVNNQAVVANVTGLTLNSNKAKKAVIEYMIFRDGTTDVYQNGELEVAYTGSDWDMSHIFSGNAGVSLSITSLGQVQYTSSDLTGHVSSTIYFLVKSLGV
jgi:hypothetical protein